MWQTAVWMVRVDEKMGCEVGVVVDGCRSVLEPEGSSFGRRGRDLAYALPVSSVMDNEGFSGLEVLYRCVPLQSHRVVPELQEMSAIIDHVLLGAGGMRKQSRSDRVGDRHLGNPSKASYC